MSACLHEHGRLGDVNASEPQLGASPSATTSRLNVGPRQFEIRTRMNEGHASLVDKASRTQNQERPVLPHGM